MKLRISRALAIVIACALALVSLVVASPAGAAGYTYRFSYYTYNTQPGERIGTDQIDPCVNTGNIQRVRGVLTDSSGASFTGDMNPTQSNGEWGYATFLVPSGASLGVASLRLECVDGSTVTRVYDAQPLNVTSQATDITATDMETGSFGHFSSSACSPGVTQVDAAIVSEATYLGTSEGANGMLFIKTVWPLSPQINSTDGSWTGEFYIRQEQYPAGSTYHLQTRCKNGSGDWYNARSFKFTITSEPYAALGDSYSSGEGSFNYDLSGGDCHRSTDSYAYYLVDRIPFDGPDFAACSGAVTDDLFNWNPAYMMDEPAQISRLSEYTNVVTLTIGGNDAGFKQVLESCVDYFNHTGFGCSNNSAMTSEVMDRIGKLSGYGSATTSEGRTIHSYEDILTGITTKAPNAKVYISGYPRLFGENPTDWASDVNAPGTFKCAVYAGTIAFVYVSYNDGMWMNDRVNDINAAIEVAVDDLNSPNVVYVPPSTFDGHGLCDSGVPYLNGVIRNDSDGAAQSESFHPNLNGMSLEYGVAFANLMK